jgi:hypothetical protein
MRRILPILGLALALATATAACGGSASKSGGATPTVTTTKPAVSVPSCADVVSGAEPVTQAVLDQPCEERGETQYLGTAFYECSDGRTLAWNDYGWGYLGEPWTAHGDGAEKVAPEVDRAACGA